MNEQLTQRIVTDLAKHRSRNEIVRMACEEGGLNWQEAEHFVQTIEAEQAHTIARKQSPLMLFLSGASIIMGIVLVYLAVDYVIGFLDSGVIGQILSVRTGWYRLAAGVTGIGMIVGGAIGLYDTSSKFFQT